MSRASPSALPQPLEVARDRLRGQVRQQPAAPPCTAFREAARVRDHRGVLGRGARQRGKGHLVLARCLGAADDGRAASHPARIEAHEVEALAQLGREALAVPAQPLDPGDARAAGVDDERADPARRVGGGDPDEGKADAAAVRLRPVDRHGQPRALVRLAAGLPRHGRTARAHSPRRRGRPPSRRRGRAGATCGGRPSPLIVRAPGPTVVAASRPPARTTGVRSRDASGGAAGDGGQRDRRARARSPPRRSPASVAPRVRSAASSPGRLSLRACGGWGWRQRHKS